MSDLLKKIDLLEREVAHLTEERRFAMNTLEMTANMITFDSGPADMVDQVHTLSETASKILSMLNFEALCFYLINEEDASFYLAYCEPEDLQPEFEQMIDQLIEDQTFAWALGRNRPVRVAADDAQRPLLLHSLTTASRTRGMFIGLLLETEDEFESPLPLLTLVLHSCANILESIELYHKLRTVNRSLESNVVKLEHSEQELQKQRLQLEDLVEQQSTDLSDTHELGDLVVQQPLVVEQLEKCAASAQRISDTINQLYATDLNPAQKEHMDLITKNISSINTFMHEILKKP